MQSSREATEVGYQKRQGVGNIAVWVLCALTAVVFFAAGVAKLLGVPQMVQLFDTIGAGQWFRYLTAVVEIGASMGLLFPRTSALAALALAATMAGAVYVHLAVAPSSPVAALVLLAAVLAIAWLRRDRLRIVPPTGMAA